jgi:hypothetical protein
MVQCADSIFSSLSEMAGLTDEGSFAEQRFTQTKLKTLISNSFDATETIQACATHQKRIVDDILTLSKLDSKLLVISPIIMQPTVLLQDTYKMFKDEANKAHVTLEARCDSSIAKLGIDYAIVDPSRVLQVLINLLTNAIKFTQDQSTRKVEVVMSASLSAEKKSDVEYVPQAGLREGFLDQPEYGDCDVFYLHFTVKDTGCGLTPEHKAKLFLRFSQASPKTHVQVSVPLDPWWSPPLTVASMVAQVLVYSSHVSSPKCKAVASVYSLQKASDPLSHSMSSLDERLHQVRTPIPSICHIEPKPNQPKALTRLRADLLPQRKHIHSTTSLLSKTTSSTNVYSAPS